jgi:bifunctional non-homologous end joining protein LigD
MPLTWAEVEGGAGGEQSDALRFQPEEAIARIGKVGDLFAAVLKLRQTLPGELMTEWRIPTGRLNLVSLERRVGPAEETARSSGQGSRKHFIAYRRGRNIEIGLDLGDHHIWRADVDAFGTVRDEAARATELHHIGSSQPPGRETVWDEGTCEVVEGSYRSGSLRLYFSGQRLRGEWSLRRRQDDWEFQHLISSPGKVITLDRAHQKGPVSDESAIAKGGVVLPDWSSLPNGSARFIQPMEADEVDSPSDLPTDRERWAYEVKWDGYRGIYVKQGTAVRLYGRSGKTIENCRHEHLDAALANSRFDDGVLDGEIVAFQYGVASFQALQNSLRNNAPVVFVVFDILNYAGRDTTPLPYVQRRQVLRSVQPLLPQEFPVPEPLDADIARMLESFKEKQIEGVVAKRRDADYRPGKRSPAWVKYWIGQVGEFVVGGYLPGKDRYFEAVAVGEYIGDALVYREQIRHGFTAADKEAIYRAISRNSIAECPFANLPQRKRRGAVDQIRMDQYVWVKPELRVLMRYKERTAAGEIREHGKFLGIARPDAA